MARICALVFIFIIFSNSVHSSHQSKRPNEPHPIPPKKPRQNDDDNRIVYVDGRPVGIRVGNQIYQAGTAAVQYGPIIPPWHHPEQTEIIFIQNGDIIKRDNKEVARVIKNKVYEIHPVLQNVQIGQEGYPKRLQLEEGDIIIRHGSAIGRIHDRQIQPISVVLQTGSTGPSLYNQQPRAPILLEEGDIIERNHEPVARVQDKTIYEINPVPQSGSIGQQQKLFAIEEGDLIIRNGRAIGRIHNNQIQPIFPVGQSESIEPPLHSQQTPAPILFQEGDIFERNQKHVARVHDKIIYEIYPASIRAGKRFSVREGDILIRNGRAIGLIRNRQIEPISQVDQAESSRYQKERNRRI